MEIVSTNFTVADFCHALNRGEVVANRKYQRSDKVWPDAARSFLIETMLLGFPMPKLYLHQKLDVRSKRAFKEIVDGQQRSRAIHDFFQDKLRLSRTIERHDLAGLVYSQIGEDYQSRFLNYSLSTDLFVAASEDEIREVFRRINSYTAPLNPEEVRHAVFQGRFKWFITRLARRVDQYLVDLGTFGDRQFVRMADAKLITEVSHALLSGIQTTDARKLKSLFQSRDVEFPEETELEERIQDSFAMISGWTELRDTELRKHYILYGLLLGVSHVTRPAASLQQSFAVANPVDLTGPVAVRNLLGLSDAISNEDSVGPFGPFVRACSGQTNVKAQRETRFRWLCMALLDQLPS